MLTDQRAYWRAMALLKHSQGSKQFRNGLTLMLKLALDTGLPAVLARRALLGRGIIVVPA